MHGSGWEKHWQHRGGPWGSGPPPWVSGLLNLAQPSPLRGPKVRRGDVRAAILDVLAVEPMNGYQIIQQIAERSGGAWKPSPGSVYPTLQQLEDEGLVEALASEGRRLVQLSAAGRTYVEEHPDDMAATWRVFDEPPGDDVGDLKPLIGQVELGDLADPHLRDRATAGRRRGDPRRHPATALRTARGRRPRMSTQPEPRIGDAERGTAAEALGEHYAAGRLTREEFDERVAQVWTAKTNSDLRPLFVDLPAPGLSRGQAGPQQSPQQSFGRSAARGAAWAMATPGPRPRRRSFPWVPLILLVIGLSFLLPGPWWLLLVGAVIFRMSRWGGCVGSHGHTRRF